MRGEVSVSRWKQKRGNFRTLMQTKPYLHDEAKKMFTHGNLYLALASALEASRIDLLLLFQVTPESSSTKTRVQSSVGSLLTNMIQHWSRLEYKQPQDRMIILKNIIAVNARINPLLHIRFSLAELHHTSYCTKLSYTNIYDIFLSDCATIALKVDVHSLYLACSTSSCLTPQNNTSFGDQHS